MKVRKSYLSVTGIILLAAAALFMGWQWRGSGREAIAADQSQAVVLAKQAEAAAEVAHLKAENERLQADLETSQKLLKQAEARPIVALSDLQISDMKTQGLKTPVSDLIADLQQRTDLIPFKGIAGGKMTFQPWLVNSRWVVSGAGDGHVGGWVILKYEVKNGQIQWTVLNSAVE